MEWVETTGHTVEEAKKYALEQLGVGESDAEVEVLAEPKTGLFGRLKEEARVRARVRPRYPRAKADRRERRRRPGGGAASSPEGAAAASSPPAAPSPTEGPAEGNERANGTAGPAQPGQPGRRRARRSGPSAKEGSAAGLGRPANWGGAAGNQAERAQEFLKGLLAELGVEATVEAHQVPDDSIELSVEGADLGPFIGPKGATLLALQELTRTIAQRHADHDGPRLVLDINGYRKRRQEALVRFVHKVAEQVRATNSRHALEPMNAADRKIVHDAVNSIPGVTTVSEGEDPYRRVVLVPAGDADPLGSAAAPPPNQGE